MTEIFELVIKNGDVGEFILGKNQYYIHNKDWDEHDYTSSWFSIMAYCMKNPKTNVFDLVNVIFEKLLNTKEKNVATYVLVHFYCNYLHCRSSKKGFESEWVLSPQLQKYIHSKPQLPLTFAKRKLDVYYRCLERIVI